MSASSKFSLILLHDDGEIHRLRMSKGLFRLVVVLLILSPILGILGLWIGWEAWHTVADWRREKMAYQVQLETMRVSVERLSTLETLLEGEKSTPASIAVLPGADRKSGEKAAGKEMSPPSAESEQKEEPDVEAEQKPAAGPMPISEKTASEAPSVQSRSALDDGTVRIENMQARLIDRTRIRVSVDLYNPGPAGHPLMGQVFLSLLTEDGRQIPLPHEDASFRISRFKKIVSTLPLSISVGEAHNAAVLLEVAVSDKIVYRNMVSIETL